MIDPADQKSSDEAIKRNTNLTPTSFREVLNATAIDFQRRVDAQGALAPTISAPRTPAQIRVTETRLDGQPITLPLGNDNQNPFPKNSTGAGEAPGTFNTPYIMGTNRTTTDPDPADDYWLASDGPHPTGGGPYDGVSARLSRVIPNPIGAGFIEYARTINFDSANNIFSVTIETETIIVPSP